MSVTNRISKWEGWQRIQTWALPLRILAFFGLVFLAVLPVGLPLAIALQDPLRSLLLAILLYLVLLTVLHRWGAWIRQSPRPFAQFGLDLSPALAQELAWGLLIGLVGLLALFAVEGWLGWLSWQPVSTGAMISTLLTGSLLGLGVAFVEELLFRGWLVNEALADSVSNPGTEIKTYPVKAYLVSAGLFAVLHFLKPLDVILATWPQFPGLVWMGCILLYSRRLRQNRLGLPIGLHAGWVWGITLVNTLGWIRYSGSIPEWVTGIQGNPLAGLMGLLFLTTTAMILPRIPPAQSPTR